MVAQLPDKGHGLGHEAPAHFPLHRVGRSKAEEVARGSVVDGHLFSGIKGRPPRVQRDGATPLNQRQGFGIHVHAVLLGLEVQARGPGERSDQAADHARQKGEEPLVCPVLSGRKRHPEGGLVGKRGERVDVGEEVVDEQGHDRPRRNRLSIDSQGRLLAAGNRDQRLGGIVWCRADVWHEPLLLGGFGGFRMLVGRAASLPCASEGAVDAEFVAGLAGLRCVALQGGNA